MNETKTIKRKKKYITCTNVDYCPTNNIFNFSEEDSGAVLEDKPSSPRRKTTSEETINHLAYPEPQPSQCHSKVCDARSVETLKKSGYQTKQQENNFKKRQFKLCKIKVA